MPAHGSTLCLSERAQEVEVVCRDLKDVRAGAVLVVGVSGEGMACPIGCLSIVLISLGFCV